MTETAAPAGAAPIDRDVLAAALDAVPDAVSIRGPDGTARFSNRAFRRLLRSAAPSIPEAATEILVAALERSRASVRVMSLEDGTTVLFAAVRPGEGALYREVLDALDASLVVYDADERYVFGNAAFHAIYPFHPPDEALIGATFATMLRNSIAAGHVAEPQAANDPEGFIRRRMEEFRGMRPGRSERLTAAGRWDLMSVQFLEEGQRISVRTEITEQKRTQEELRQAKERQEADSNARLAFLDHLSRELRTPLGSVLGYAELIEGEVLGPIGSDKYREYGALIRHAGQLLLSLIDDVLDSARAGPVGLEMREAPVDLVDLLRRELTVVEPLARENQTSIFLDLPDHLPRLSADPRMVRQMVLNLLSNAVKFTVRNTVTVSLRRRSDGGIDLIVADRGAGMPPEVLARVGEPYFRGARADDGSESGTGLGLTVVKELLALHGGRLLMESAIGRGTTATLAFPPARTIPAPVA